MRSLLAIPVLVFLGACATVKEHGSASFEIRCTVPDAMVFIDDVMVGRVSEWAPPGRAIRPGFHRVEIRHPDYHSHFQELDLRHGESRLVEARLHPLLP